MLQVTEEEFEADPKAYIDRARDGKHFALLDDTGTVFAIIGGKPGDE